MTRYRIILLIMLFGFIGLGIEVRYDHQKVIHEFWQAWIPLVGVVVGVIACLLALSSSTLPRYAAMTAFVLLVAAGFVGLYFHTGYKPSELARLFHNESDKLFMHTEDGDIQPPALAPMILSGIALVAAIAARGDWERRRYY